MRSDNELTITEWNQLISDRMFSNITTLDITGGEAVLTPDFIQLISLFLDKMPKIKTLTMVSNGFATELVVKQVKQILKLCTSREISFNVSVSLDGKDNMHETIRRIPNAFEKTKSTIEALLKIQLTNPLFSVSVGSLIMRQNVNNTQEIKNWLEQHHIKYGFQIVGFHDTYVRNLDTEKSTDFNKKDIPKLSSLLTKLAKPTSWKDVRAYYWRDLLAMYRDGKRRTTPCPFLHDQLAIDSLGNIYNCFSTAAIGNVRNGKTPSQLYFSKENINKRKLMWSTVCTKCNSGCSASEATAKDLIHYLYFRLTGEPFYGIKPLIRSL